MTAPITPKQMLDRLARGQHLCAISAVRHLGGARFSVASATTGEIYTVDLNAGTCECPDHHYRQTCCKHLLASADYAATYGLPWDAPAMPAAPPPLPEPPDDEDPWA